jgi:FtsP/CotA-like multicopper oxidase with cupredoxin domain
MPRGKKISRRLFLGQTLACVFALPGRAEPPGPQDGPRILEAREGKLMLLPEPGQPTVIWGYEGAVPGPLLRFKKGEEVKIRLVNKLPQPTSLTWHGVRILNSMDGVAGLTQAPVPPGGAFDYRFTPPDSGLYWYHPHVLPFFAGQLAHGLCGVMIIDEPEPPIADRDMVVILSDWDLDSKGQIKKYERPDAAIRADGADRNFQGEEPASPPPVMGGLDPAVQAHQTGVWMPGLRPGMTAEAAGNDHWNEPLVTVNARSVPLEELLPASSRLRLRIVNACTRHIVLTFAGLTPFVLAIDSQPCEVFAPAKNMIPLGPGARADVMADLPSEPAARATLSLLGDQANRALLAFKTAGSQRSPLPAISSLPQNPLLPAAIKLEASRRFNITIDALAAAQLAVPQAQPAAFTLSGKAYDGFAPPPLFSVKRGMPLTLGFTNRTGSVQAIHLHGHAMRLLHDLDDGWEPYWRDTLLVAEGKTKHVAFVADNPGKWAIDCLTASGQEGALASWFEVT